VGSLSHPISKKVPGGHPGIVGSKYNLIYKIKVKGRKRREKEIREREIRMQEKARDDEIGPGRPRG
jgi:hypothetical protein